jgi:hypothetical protein
VKKGGDLLKFHGVKSFFLWRFLTGAVRRVGSFVVYLDLASPVGEVSILHVLRILSRRRGVRKRDPGEPGRSRGVR